MKTKYFLLLSVLFILFSCSPKMSFEDQIIHDIKSKFPTGICKDIPKGSVLSNVVVGEIVDIGLDGMTDVSYEFDFEYNGEKKHHASALLYLKRGSHYVLASMGGDCDFEYGK